MIKVFIIDDDREQLDRGHRLVAEMFSSVVDNKKEGLWLDTEVDVQIEDLWFDTALAPDKVASSIEDSLTRHRPQIIICDNKMGKNEAWGQTFLAKIKILIPEAVTCLLTREILKSSQFGARTPNPDVVMDKGHLGGDVNYRRYLRNRILSQVTSCSNIRIEWAKPFEDIFSSFRDSRGRRATREEVQSLIEQCFFDGSFSTSARTIDVDQVTGGRSGSVVLSCKIRGDLNYGITGVIKISGRIEASREAQNYRTYVKWVLPYTWKVEVLGIGHTEGIGAVCYSFAFDGDGRPTSGADMMQKADKKIIKKICSTIFSPKSNLWYSKNKESEYDASEYFQKEPFFLKASQLQDREDKFICLLSRLYGDEFEHNDRTIKLFGVSVGRPNSILFTNDWGRVEECICHGDLNANNILVNVNKKEENNGLVFIDFQKTGFQNIFRDFISVESSIRIDWGEKIILEQAKSLFKEEIDLSRDPSFEKLGYLGQAQIIRHSAFKNFPTSAKDTRSSLYLIAAFVHFSWLATRFSDWTDSGLIRLTLGAFASLVELESTLTNRNNTPE